MKKVVSLLLVMAMTVALFAGCGAVATSSDLAEVSAPETAASKSEAPEAADSKHEVPSAQEESAEEPVVDYDEVFVVVHTNDVHGFIDVEPYVKSIADSYKEQYGEKNVLTVSAGDVFAGGNAVAHLYNGETIPPIMDAVGYDVVAPGNNDFNLGDEQLLVLGNSFTHAATICANLYDQVKDENGETVLDENEAAIPGENLFFPGTIEYETSGGVKIGVFGLTTAGGPVGETFAHMASVDAAQNAVDELRADDCSVIIGVGHTGWNDDLVTPSANDVTSAELVKSVAGIDAYVDGHSHSIIGDGFGWVCPETGTLVNQASCKGKCVGVMTLYIKDGAVVDKEARLIMEDEMKSEYIPNPEVQAIVDAAWERLAGDAGENYGETEYFLNAYRATESDDGRSVRTDETNLGDLAADAMRWYAKSDVGVMPGFRIRASIPEGSIYTINLYDVFANGCDLYVVELTGQELLEKLAAGLHDLPNESPQFIQVSGVSFGYIVNPETTDEGEMTYTIVNPMVNGEPLDLNKIYTYAGDMGGPDAPENQDPILTGMEAVAEVFGEYLKSGEAVILPDVPTPDNRIIPMESAPEGAVTYKVTLAAINPM